MNSTLFRSLALTLVVVAGIGSLALAQSGSMTQSPGKDSGSMHGMMSGSGSMQGMMGGGMGNMDDMMRMCGMTPEMVEQGRLLMHAELNRDDPAALLGLKDRLNLTAAQVKQLNAIQDRARNDARAILNAKQQGQLATLPATPGSMASMHRQMMTHMQQMSGKSGAPTGNSDAPCMMMQMMMRPSGTPAATSH